MDLHLNFIICENTMKEIRNGKVGVVLNSYYDTTSWREVKKHHPDVIFDPALIKLVEAYYEADSCCVDVKELKDIENYLTQKYDYKSEYADLYLTVVWVNEGDQILILFDEFGESVLINPNLIKV